MRDEVAVDVLRVHEVRHAELARERLARRVDVDADDHVGAGHARALDDVEPDAAEPEHDDVRAGLDLRGVDHRADAGRDAAADVADLVERRVLADLRERDLRQHRVVRERRAAHVVVDLGLADREAARAVGHQALALRRADRGAQVRLAAQARFAGAALRRVERDHVVALGERSSRRRRPRRRRPRPRGRRSTGNKPSGSAPERVNSSVWQTPGRLDLDEHLAGLRAFELDVLDHERLARFVGDGCARLHAGTLP